MIGRHKVYVFGEPGDNLLKVGVSISPKRRRHCLRSTERMPRAVMLYECVLGGWDAARWVERRAHELLCRHRIVGEWFLADFDEVATAIHAAIEERFATSG